MNIPYAFKKCTKCGRWLVANKVNFYKKRYLKRGVCNECKKHEIDCAKKRRAEYNKQYCKQYYQNNKDKIVEHKKQYYQSPQGQVTLFNGCQRRRIKEEQQGTGITKNQWVEMMSFFDWKCAYSGKYIGGNSFNRTLDHIVPLNSGGDHEIWNLVPMTKSLNSSKQDKDMIDWYREQDCYSEARLAKIYEWQEYARKKWKK